MLTRTSYLIYALLALLALSLWWLASPIQAAMPSTPAAPDHSAPPAVSLGQMKSENMGRIARRKD
jgi:hypothetical protein